MMMIGDGDQRTSAEIDAYCIKTCKYVILENGHDKIMKKELNTLSSNKRAVNGLSHALKAGSSFRLGAHNST